MEDMKMNEEYYNLIKNSKKMSIKEFDALIREGNNHTRFIEGLMPFIYKTCSNIYNVYQDYMLFSYSFDDFFQDCTLLAIDLYESDYFINQGYNTFIKYYSLHCANLLKEKINLSYNAIKTIKEMKDDYYKAYGSSIDTKDLLEREDVRDLIFRKRQDESLTNKEFMVENWEEDVLDSIYKETLEDDIDEALLLLPERILDIICRYYGFYGQCEKVESIKDSYGVSHQRITELREKGLKKIKKSKCMQKYF